MNTIVAPPARLSELAQAIRHSMGDASITVPDRRLRAGAALLEASRIIVNRDAFRSWCDRAAGIIPDLADSYVTIAKEFTRRAMREERTGASQPNPQKWYERGRSV